MSPVPMLAAAMPLDDWQFWVVTLIVLSALVLGMRTVVRGKRRPRTTLTISAGRGRT